MTQTGGFGVDQVKVDNYGMLEEVKCQGGSASLY
jgi:hypothetical protein